MRRRVALGSIDAFDTLWTGIEVASEGRAYPGSRMVKLTAHGCIPASDQLTRYVYFPQLNFCPTISSVNAHNLFAFSGS